MTTLEFYSFFLFRIHYLWFMFWTRVSWCFILMSISLRRLNKYVNCGQKNSLLNLKYSYIEVCKMHLRIMKMINKNAVVIRNIQIITLCLFFISKGRHKIQVGWMGVSIEVRLRGERSFQSQRKNTMGWELSWRSLLIFI